MNTLSADPQPLQAACPDENNGLGTVTVSGGTAPYTYLWDNGETTETASNLTAGDHTVTITDDMGCDIVSTVSIAENPAIVIMVDQVEPAVDNQNNGSISVTINGGSPGYSFAWYLNGGFDQYRRGSHRTSSRSLCAGSHR